jgi:glycosyltransferase involved in cell wall biosynthesis
MSKPMSEQMQDITFIFEVGKDFPDLMRRFDEISNYYKTENSCALVYDHRQKSCIENILASSPLKGVLKIPVLSSILGNTDLPLKNIRTKLVGFIPENAFIENPQSGCHYENWQGITPWIDTIDLNIHSERLHKAYATKWIMSADLFKSKIHELGPPVSWNFIRVLKKLKMSKLHWQSIKLMSQDIHPDILRVDNRTINQTSKVLALVPHFRCEEWLPGCLESLIRQTHPLDGIVVIDDGSESPPREIIKAFPQVTLYTSTQNVGPYRLVQEIISNTDYDAYLFQDADDWSTVDRLALLLAEAERTGAELIGTQEIRVFCDEEEILPVCFPLDVNNALKVNPIHPLLHPTSIVSRNLVMRLGGFATGLHFGGDTEFLYRAHHAARIINIPYYCYYRRQRYGSLTTTSRTGLKSPMRVRLWDELKEKARINAELVASGAKPVLKPYRIAMPVKLTHDWGPSIRWING